MLHNKTCLGWRRFRFPVFIAAITAMLLWVIWASPSFQQCIAGDQTQALNRVLQMCIPISHAESLNSYKICTENWVEQNKEILDVLATIFIAIFTGTLWRSTDKLWEAGERQLKVSRELSKIADQQTKIQTMQTDIQEKAHALSRMQFFVVHRPKLILRKAYAIRPKENEPITVQYTIANIGESRATIIGMKTEIVVATHHESLLNTIMSPHPVLDKDIGKIYEPAQFENGVHTDNQKWTRDILAGAAGIKCYFFGHILYKDERDIVRETVFCRAFECMTARFRRPDDPELDYAD